MKKILVVLVCLLTTVGTMSLKAQNNLSEGQWKHGLAIGAQWIATDLGFGKAESEIIGKTSENYSLDDLRVAYGRKPSGFNSTNKYKHTKAESAKSYNN